MNMMNGIERLMKQWMLLGMLLLLPVSGYAQSGFPVLDKFFSNVNGFEADFEQTVFDENFNELQNSSGKMALSRPDRFKWSYVEPYEQLIVGDGKEVWIYDIDLDQITVKPQGETLGETPAQLLSSSKPIVDEFSVNELGERMGLLWYELRPLADDNAFHSIRLGFRGEQMQRMELKDGLGNQTVFAFTHVIVNPDFAQDYFNFIPPKGVDVIGRD